MLLNIYFKYPCCGKQFKRICSFPDYVPPTSFIRTVKHCGQIHIIKINLTQTKRSQQPCSYEKYLSSEMCPSNKCSYLHKCKYLHNIKVSIESKCLYKSCSISL